ncbi:site-specific tyrosine recombinase/integron integrase [Flavobacteriaceae bacterium LMO-SS05]
MSVLPTIRLTPKYHRGAHQVCLTFPFNEDLIALARGLSGARWSATFRCWYVPYDSTIISRITTLFEGHATLINKIDHSLIGKTKHDKRVRDINASHRTILLGFRDYLRGKRYSNSTVSTYLALTADLVEFYNDTPLEDLTNRSVELFIERIMVPKNYSVSTHRQFISALKLFCLYYPSCKINDVALTMPKKDKRLPSVLSQEEVLDLIRCTQNLKHRTILALIYSCGLRIGELIGLKLKDIDVDRRQVVVRQGKGRKDRYVILAESFLPLLKNYILSYQPKLFVFEGQSKAQYSPESIRSFLKGSCKKAGISKYVTPHTLRHSYATHLLEQGIDIRYIQELLGHAKPETTMIYTHVSKKDLLQIKSPLDIAIKRVLEQKPHSQGLLSDRL